MNEGSQSKMKNINFETGKRNISVAVLLTLSGGFLDAFAYVGHGHVFANTMTGNVALLGINISASDWPQALHHIPPLVAFVLAIFVEHLMRLDRDRRWVKHPAMTCLILEIAFLVTAASRAIPIDDFWLVPGISFLATLQTLFFTNVENIAFTSVMTTGNLRRGTQKLFTGLIPHYDAAALHDARLLWTIGMSFLAGAVVGGYTTSHMHNSALWVAAAFLVTAMLQIYRIAFLQARRDAG